MLNIILRNEVTLKFECDFFIIVMYRVYQRQMNIHYLLLYALSVNLKYE
jgi:hypothetical protein